MNIEDINDYETMECLLPLVPQLQELPSNEMLREDPVAFAKIIFELFGVPQSISNKLTVERLKSGIYFTINFKNNILYTEDGKIYFGESIHNG